MSREMGSKRILSRLCTGNMKKAKIEIKTNGEWKFQLCELNYDHLEQRQSVLERVAYGGGNFLRLSIIKIRVCLFQVQLRTLLLITDVYSRTNICFG